MSPKFADMAGYSGTDLSAGKPGENLLIAEKRAFALEGWDSTLKSTGLDPI